MNRIISPLSLGILHLAGLLVVGTICGCTNGQSTGTVNGIVTVDGKPMGGFEVIFTSSDDGTTARGYAKQQGEYQLFVGRGSHEIPVGEYKVTVIPSAFVQGVPEPTVKLPAAFASVEDTDLVKTVGSGANQLDLEISTK
ncbi:MAG: hypothetical protein WDZ51_17465 [Pirellulaceae bacterium]